MKNRALVSVVVPVYNVEKYIKKCLDSLLDQDYQNLEVVVVDDGSTDGGGKICDEYALKDERIRVYHKKNGGLSSARNYGIRRAHGEYICLVDSDDAVKSAFVEKMVRKAEEKDADIVVCGYNDDIPTAEVTSGRNAAIKLLVQQDNMEIIAWNKMYRRCLFDEILYPEGQNYEDSLTTYKLLAKAKNVVYIAEPLYSYVERGESITKQDKKDVQLLARERAAREAIDYFEGDDDLSSAAEIALLTAKLAWIDFGLNGVVEMKRCKNAEKWIRDNRKKYVGNKYMTAKLRTYIKMISFANGAPYRLFRRIRHE